MRYADPDDLTADYPQARRELEQLRAYADALDAERYRWLSARMLAAQRAESDRLERLAVGKRFSMAAMVARLAALAVPADAPQVATPEPVGTQPAPPTFLELGDIEAMLGFALPAEFITLTLGIKPAATDDGAPLFNPRQLVSICEALLVHITKIKESASCQ